MTKENKIIEYKLEDDVVKMKESGMTYREIANALNLSNNTDGTFSHMAIKRFFDSYKVQVHQEELDKGLDPMNHLRDEFKERMYTLDDDTHEIYKTMRKALKAIAKEGDNYKTIKACRETLNAIEQSRKNWSSLIQWGINEFRPIEQAKETNVVKINNLLVNMSRELCPNCRSKVVGLVVSKEEQNE